MTSKQQAASGPAPGQDRRTRPQRGHPAANDRPSQPASATVRDERHRDALAPGDLILIYLAPPAEEFIGQAELASAVQEWTSAEAEVDPGDSPGGVLLSHAEEWEPTVAMASVLPRVDPEASNPYVQANAKAGFRAGVIRITPHEYETVLAVRAEGLPAGG